MTRIWEDHPEAVQYITEHWKNLSARNLAMLLSVAYGTRITRNAVMGKISRLNLGVKPYHHISKFSPVLKLSKNRVRDNIRLPPVPIKPVPVLSNCYHLTLVELEDNTCRWPLDYDTDGVMRYCGTRTNDRVYCDYHTRIGTISSRSTPKCPPVVSNII